MNMVARVTEVWISEEPKALPLDYGGSCSYEIDVCVFIVLTALRMSFSRFGEEGSVVANSWFILEQRLPLG